MRGVVSKGKKVIEVKQKELYEIDEDGEFLHKTELIKKKEAELRKNYSFVDPKRKKNAETLIKRAAFMDISLLELESIINLKGYEEEYKNGANQYGTKKRSQVDTYNVMVKNHIACIKQLEDMMEKDRTSQETGDDLMEFLKTGK